MVLSPIDATSRDSTTAVDWPSLLFEPQVQHLIALAIEEDLGTGDITTDAIFRRAQPVTAQLLAKSPCVLCGLPLAMSILGRFDATATWRVFTSEGERALPGSTLATLTADIRAVLSAERAMLNFLMRLSGIAANARRAVETLPATCRAQVFDTRKTTPGWRLLEKAAVRTGGARNHRFGLFDAFLIKDNHIAAAGSIRTAINLARASSHDPRLLEVEVEDLQGLEEAIASGADIVLLDNFNHADLRRAVSTNAGRVKLEASGGVKWETLSDIAKTGVDRISMGALTHSVTPPDLSLELLP